MAPSQRRRLAQLDVGRALRRHEPFGAALAGARERGASAREAVQPTERDVKGVGRGGEGAGNVAASRRRAVVEAVRALSDRATHRSHACAGSRDRVSGEAATALLVTLLGRRAPRCRRRARPPRLLRRRRRAGARAAQPLRARLGAAVGRTPVVGARLAVLVGGGYSAQRLAQDDDGDGAGDGEFRAKSKAKTPEAGTPDSEGDDDGGGDDGDAGGGGGAWVDINGGYGDEGEGEEEEDDDEAASSVVPSSSVAALSRVSLAPLD